MCPRIFFQNLLQYLVHSLCPGIYGHEIVKGAHTFFASPCFSCTQCNQIFFLSFFYFFVCCTKMGQPRFCWARSAATDEAFGSVTASIFAATRMCWWWATPAWGNRNFCERSQRCPVYFVQSS